MSRGFKIALLFVVGVVLVLLLIPKAIIHIDYKPKDQATVDALSVALKAYNHEYGSFPTGSQAAVMKALCGSNMRHIVFFDLPSSSRRTNALGEFLDPWDTPYEISIISTNEFRIRSAGPNKQVGDEDDITSDGDNK